MFSQLVTILTTEINLYKQRLAKFTGFARADVQTAIIIAPYGTDSNPIAGVKAIYAPTGNKLATVMVGCINTSNLADVGEHRTYSTDSDGNVKFTIWLKKDGTAEIGGNDDNMVRYSELAKAFNQLKDDFNALVSKYNAFATAYVPGGPTSVGTPPNASTASSSTADITGAKIDNIKTVKK
jgi:hypothetical protein